MSMLDDRCMGCGHPECFCACPQAEPARPTEIPWNGEPYTFGHELSDSIKQFTDKMQGHIRREFRYRAFAKAILEQLPDLRSQLRNASDADNLDRVLARWNIELDDIAKL